MTHSTPIVLTTANARYSHTALGLRYLLANLGQCADGAQIIEFTLTDRPLDMAERIVATNPRIVGMSVHIWNEPLLRETAQILKQVAPRIRLILGGPEVVCPADLPPIAALADHVVCGEGEIVFAQLARALLSEEPCELPRILESTPVDPGSIVLPYDHYSDDDIAHRTLYFEASRGCPFGCEFCLSSLDAKVRHFSTERVMTALDALYDRGARRFKFVDRTFNVGCPGAIIAWFAGKNDPCLFAHFEVVPDRIDDAWIAQLAGFDAGAVQLEAGIQTLSDDVALRIGRRQNVEKALYSIERLLRETRVHLHADLVAGLPGESLAGFARGFDRLFATGVHEIQVGVLKRLRGAPIDRHTAAFGMKYRPSPPFDLLCNDQISFGDMQRIKRFSRYFDLVYNSGNFVCTAPMLLNGNSAFQRFMDFCDWLYLQIGQTGNIALDRLAEQIFCWLTGQMQLDPGTVADALLHDYTAVGRRRYPACVRLHATGSIPKYNGLPATDNRLPARQQRHVDAAGTETSGES